RVHRLRDADRGPLRLPRAPPPRSRGARLRPRLRPRVREPEGAGADPRPELPDRSQPPERDHRETLRRRAGSGRGAPPDPRRDRGGRDDGGRGRTPHEGDRRKADRTRILEMVAAGELSPADADRLLAAAARPRPPLARWLFQPMEILPTGRALAIG